MAVLCAASAGCSYSIGKPPAYPSRGVEPTCVIEAPVRQQLDELGRVGAGVGAVLLELYSLHCFSRAEPCDAITTMATWSASVALQASVFLFIDASATGQQRMSDCIVLRERYYDLMQLE